MARSGRLHLNVSGEESLNLFLFVVDLSASLGKILGQSFSLIALDAVPVFLRLFSPSFLNTCRRRKCFETLNHVWEPVLSEERWICHRAASFGKEGQELAPRSKRETPVFYSSKKNVEAPQSSRRRQPLRTPPHRQDREPLWRSRCTPPRRQGRTPAQPPSSEPGGT